MFDINDVLKSAKEEVAAEEVKKAKEAIKAKLKQRALAQQVLANIDREIEDLTKSIADGSFTN